MGMMLRRYHEKADAGKAEAVAEGPGDPQVREETETASEATSEAETPREEEPAKPEPKAKRTTRKTA